MFDFYDKLPTARKLMDAAKAAYDAPEPTHLRAFDKFARDQLNGKWRRAIANVNPRDWTTLSPENPLREMVQTYLPHVLGSEVNPEIVPFVMSNAGQATLREYRLRRLIDDIGMESEHDQAVMDAMFSIGITKFGIRAGQTLMRFGDSTIDMGQAFIARVPLDAFVYDPNVPNWSRKAYMGDCYTVCPDALLEEGIGDPKVIESIGKVWDQDRYGGKAAAPWMTGGQRQDEFIDDEIPVWDFTFIHRGRRFRCILPPFDGIDEFIVAPFEDMEPEIGPYNVLELGLTTGEGVSLSPAMALMDAHLIRQKMAGRLAWEGLNTRRKVVADQGDQAFVMKLLDPTNPDGVVFGNGQTAKEVVIGGMTKELLEAYMTMKAMSQSIGPNVALAGGQEDPSDSATGTSILAGNAGLVMDLWRKRVDKWAAGNVRRLSWSLDSEDGFEEQYDYPLPDGSVIPIVWNANTRDTSYQVFKYGVRPAVSADMDSRQRLRSLFEIMVGLGPFLQSTVGIGGDPQAAIAAVASLSRLPELSRILPTGNAQFLYQQIMGQLMQAQHKQAAAGGGQVPASPSGRTNQMQSDYAQTRVPA